MRRSSASFDVSVPGEGLVIWHVVNGRPALVEATGFTGPRAPTMNVQNIPYPNPRNDEYTPYSGMVMNAVPELMLTMLPAP